MSEPQVIHNQDETRFELPVDGEKAILEYYIDGASMVFAHTEVPEEFEGRGYAAKLARAGLDYARNAGLRIVPRCSFIAAYLKEHPEYL